MVDLNQKLFEQESGSEKWYEQGSIIWVTFDPTLGHEQQGRRPAVVVSNKAFYLLTRMIKVLAISSSLSQAGFPANVCLPSGSKTQGYVLTDQERSIDPVSRNVELIERCPEKTFDEILQLVLISYQK